MRQFSIQTILTNSVFSISSILQAATKESSGGDKRTRRNFSGDQVAKSEVDQIIPSHEIPFTIRHISVKCLHYLNLL